MSIVWCLLVLVQNCASQMVSLNALTFEEFQILENGGFTVTPSKHNATVTYRHYGRPSQVISGPGNQTEVRMVNHSYTVPLPPTTAEVKGCVGGLGAVGIAINGGAFLTPYTASGRDALNGACAEELDECQGHMSSDETYHYHGIPTCLYTGDLRDKFLGFAFDGYPIWGPMDSSGKNWTTADLDECHGHTYKGRYVYRLTYDFPYTISCFHGKSMKNDNQKSISFGRPGGELQSSKILENDKCLEPKYSNWDQLICHVVCQNAGDDLEDCVDTSRGERLSKPLYVTLIQTAAVAVYTFH